MIVLFVALFVLFLYFYLTRNQRYWSKRNIKHDYPVPLFGNHLQVVLRKKTLTDVITELYNKFPEEKVIGYYRGTTPELIIKDPEIIRNVLSADFDYFYSRSMGRDSKKEPMLNNMFHSDGDTWKLLRKGLSPMFTSAKIKAMFPLIIQCADKLQHLGDKIVSEGGEFDAEDIISRFTIEFIGACGFGIEMDTINSENSAFKELGRRIFSNSLSQKICFSIWELIPEIRFLVTVFDKELEKHLMEIVTSIVEKRNYKSIGRNDFIDHFLDLMNRGKLTGASIEHKNPDGTPKLCEMTMDLKCLAAQVFLFFGAGFETSSSSSSYTLHELAFHPDMQLKIQQQIDDVLAKYDNKLCYEAITEMTLLERAFKEALRKLPPVGYLNRECTKSYSITKLNICIDPGTKIIIPIQALHFDEKYFENAEEFCPERFTPEEENKRPKYVYLPFGDGPRACIGARLGQLQSLAGLATILQKFTVEPSVNTRRNLKMSTMHELLQTVEGGKPLKLKMRNK